MMHLMNHAEAPATPIVQIAAGDFVTCALDVDGEVHCWGRDVAGSTFEPPGEFVQVTSSDAYGTCAISAAGQVMCWGQFVNGRRRDAVYTLKGSFTQVTVGDDWVCAINVRRRTRTKIQGCQLQCSRDTCAGAVPAAMCRRPRQGLQAAQHESPHRKVSRNFFFGACALWHLIRSPAQGQVLGAQGSCVQHAS